MIKKIWDRRRKQKRRHNSGNNIHSPQRAKLKKHRKRGQRRRRAATLILGLSTIMPVPSAKLIEGAAAQAKRHITVAGTLKKKQETGSNTIFSGRNKNNQVHLWIPPSFENQICESERSAVAPVRIEIIKPEELRPAFSYSDIVYPVAMKHNVDWRLVAAVIQAESSFNPDAVSPVGARGLMQLMPATAAEYGITLKTIDDPEANVEAGVKHLKKLSELYGGDITLIAAAYNAGQGTVAKFDGIPPFEETRNYVERVVSYYNSFAA